MEAAHTVLAQWVLFVLYTAGAAAAALLVARIYGTASGCCVGLFYAVVLAMLGAGSVDMEGIVGSSLQAGGSLLSQKLFETVLVALVGIIVWEFLKQQLALRHQGLQQQQQPVPEEQDQDQQLHQQQDIVDAISAAAEDHQLDATAHGRYNQATAISKARRSNEVSSLGCTPSRQLQPYEQAISCSTGDTQQEQQLSSHHHQLQQQSAENEEFWRALPDAVFIDVLERLPAVDQGRMRAVCTHWFDAGRRTITSLRPHHFPVKELVSEFPSLKALDLSNCTKDISPAKLRWLRCLPALEDVILGCHHRLIASTVTDMCIVELVTLTNIRSLNLSQCVHVGDGGMMSLVHLPGLRSLNISGCVAVTDIGIMMVAQLSNLTSLDMPWCVKVTNIGLKALAPLTKLQNLNISGCQLITEPGICSLAAFTNLEKLSMLNLGYSKVCVTDAALERLSTLTKLRSLNIGNMQLLNKLVTDRSLKLISSNHKQLTQLGLMSLDISDAGVSMLAQLSDLQALNLRGCTNVSSSCLRYLSTLTRITDLCLLHNSKLEVDDACLASLSKLPNLQILGLGNYKVNARVSDTCLVPLSNAKHLLVLSIAFFAGKFGPETCSMLSRMSSLQHLDLQGSQHADGGLLQAVGQLTALQSLHLSRCCQVDDAALQHITSLSNLHTLNISMCFKVTDVGLAAVTKLQNLTHLLAQQCRDVTDAGVAQLGRLTKLQVLDLSACERITGCGFQAFAGCKHMATLSLNGCSSLNDGGLRSIGKILSLTKLDLSNCQLVTDVGVSYLRGLIELTGLDLAQCVRIGDAAMAAIASTMRQLATLKVNGCIRVTDLGVNELCQISSLLTLHLDRCMHITDLGLQCLTKLTGLTSLRVSRCPNITDAGVAHLSKLSRLSTLSLAQCPRVTDVGLIALAPLTTLASLEF